MAHVAHRSTPRICGTSWERKGWTTFTAVPQLAAFVDTCVAAFYVGRVLFTGTACWLTLVLVVLPALVAVHVNALLAAALRVAGLPTRVQLTAWPPAPFPRNERARAWTVAARAAALAR